MKNRRSKLKTTHSAVITSDPLETFRRGQSVRFAPTRIRTHFDGKYVVPSLGMLKGVVLSIHFSMGDKQQAIGSAVMVAPGVALTAAHVVNNYWEELRSGETEAMLFGIANTGIQIWRPKTVTCVEATDTAILGLTAASKLPPNSTFEHSVISTRIPSVGENVVLAGTRGPDASALGPKTRTALDLFAAQGPVTERFVFPTGRDSLMLPWPTIYFDCPSIGGMSGGPAFDEAGCLIGILSASMGNTMDDATPSYVSLIYPALHAKFSGGWPIKYPFARSLMEDPLCEIEGRNAFTQEYDSVTEENIVVFQWQESDPRKHKPEN